MVIPVARKLWQEIFVAMAAACARRWRTLVLQHRVSGIQVHDARIVAAMRAHRVSKILTFDLNDFKGYDGITVAEPKSL